jgi:hypothetical protein
MQDSPSQQVGQSALPTRTSRRAIVSWTLKLAGGAAFVAAVPGSEWVRVAAAQDDEIILTASASEVGARPGGAYANGAAARAVADYEGGVSTQGAGGGAGSGAGPGDSSGAGPGDQTGTGGGGSGGGTGSGPGDSSGAGPGGGGGGGGTGGGDQSGAGPGNSDGSGSGDQSGGGGGY